MGLTISSPMDAESLRDLLLAQPHATEETPFGPEHLVFKIGGEKMFAILSPDEFPVPVNLKCDPQRALELRDQHEAILPGYHMNKRHWNTVLLDGTIPGALLSELVAHSYDLVHAGMTKKLKEKFSK
jgi:predicted DNA-binding protein (MmcQ/YjbR family)